MAVAKLARTRRRVESIRGVSGFTMAELVIAMMILGVVLVLLAAVQISAITTVTEARKLQQATAFANEAVEQMHAIPWNTLSRGMYSDFLAVSGGDPLVVGGVLKLSSDPLDPGVPLVIAPAAADQDLDNPARPLFDEYGSHIQVRQDPSLAGVDFTIKGYVTEASDGPGFGIVGIAVVVEWTNRHGGTSRTSVWSEAYRGGVTSCGSADSQPFLAACQSFFEASSGTGNVTAEISASNIDVDPALVGPRPLMYPASTPEYSLSMRSAGVSASMRSQQVNYADGIIQFGGNTVDDGDPATPATQTGFANYTLRATDDVTNQSGWLPNPIDLSVTQGATAETEDTVGISSSPVSLRTRSDYARTGTADASMTESCATGIPAGQPCAKASLSNQGELWSGSGYILMEIEGQIFRLSRRLVENLSAPKIGNVESAWVARFASAPGSAAVGCTTLTGAGCVSAGATRTMAPLNIGTVYDSSWDTVATEGMVILEGDPAVCPAGYTESVLVQRGENQKTTAPDFSRCGRLRYWSGAAYTPVIINAGTSGTYDTAPVTWTKDDHTVIATTQIQILPAYYDNPAPEDPLCETSACTVNVSAGTIIMVSTYIVRWHDGTGTPQEYVLIVSTTVTSPSAQASYTAAPHVS